MKNALKIKIIGAGPTGSMLAYYLYQIGCQVVLYDLNLYNELIRRNRAYALTHSSMKLLSKLGIWDELENKLNGFTNLIIRDAVIGKQAVFKSNELLDINRNQEFIGWMLDHSDLMNILLSRIKNNTDIDLRLGEAGSLETNRFDLVVTANGNNFRAGTKFPNLIPKFKYKQSCLSVKLLLRGADSKTAFEILRKDGPLAILPMGSDLFQIVMSGPYEKLQALVNSNQSLLLDRISSIMPNNIQVDSIIGNASIFPTYFYLSPPIINNKCIRIGESAHSFHPVGGQGLNLCWRDVNLLGIYLNYVKRRRLSINALPPLYCMNRISDVITIGLTTDVLIRLFSNNNLLMLPIRTVILYLLSKYKILKKQVLNIMTNGLTFRKLN